MPITKTIVKIVGPSGVGKTTLFDYITQQNEGLPWAERATLVPDSMLKVITEYKLNKAEWIQEVADTLFFITHLEAMMSDKNLIITDSSLLASWIFLETQKSLPTNERNVLSYQQCIDMQRDIELHIMKLNDMAAHVKTVVIQLYRPLSTLQYLIRLRGREFEQKNKAFHAYVSGWKKAIAKAQTLPCFKRHTFHLLELDKVESVDKLYKQVMSVIEEEKIC